MIRKLSAALTLMLCLSASARAADHFCTTSAQLTTALANAVGGDTITLQAGNTFVGPFTLRSGLTSTVTVRSSAHASLPGNDVRVTNSDRANMPIIHCGNFANQPCFLTDGADADNWRLTGLEIRPQPGDTVGELIRLGSTSDSVLANTPNNIEIDHCYIHAPEAGSKRGIYLSGRNVNIHDNHIAGFRVNGQDSQAILIAEAPGPVTIRNNYLSALGEVVMAGGTGAPATTMSGNLTMTRNYLEVPQKYNPWIASTFDETDVPSSHVLPCTVTSSGTAVTCNGHGRPVNAYPYVYVIKLTSGPQAGQKRTVRAVPTANTMTLTEAFSANQSGASATLYGFWPHKNIFELKMLTGTSNLIEGNVFDGAWIAGQDGYAIVFTVRAQYSSGSPHAVIKNVTFRYNYIKRAWSGIQFLTTDYLFTTDYMQNFTVAHNVFEGLGSGLYGSPGNLRSDAILISNGELHGADGLTVSHNTFVHAQTTPQWGTSILFAGADSTSTQRHTNLSIKDNFISFENYGIRSNGGLSGTAALAAAANTPYTYAHNALYRASSTAPAGYPTTDNWYETSSTPIGWADAANSDYSLSSGDYRAGQSRQASDGTNVGADITTLTSKIGASSNAYSTATIKAVSGVWPSSSQTPYGGSPTSMPGSVEAENFDNGGEAVAYHDEDAGNNGGEYRTTDVDIRSTSTASNGFVVFNARAGEWLEYTINVGTTGTYEVGATVASRLEGGTFHIEVDGVNVTGSLTVPTTGSWWTFQPVSKTGVQLTAGTHVLRLALDTNGVEGIVADFDTVFVAASGLPSPWLTQDIGGVGVQGSAIYSGSVFTVKGSGADLWGNTDSFRYVYQTLSGDGQIVARVTGVEYTNASAKAGVMIREALTANSAHVILNVNPQLGGVVGLEFMKRPSAGANTTFVAGSSVSLSMPRWLKLVRSGNTFTSYISGDGVNWTLVGSTSVTMSGSVYVGLIVCSVNNAVLNTSTFDNVSKTP